jgi:hypothetical protein
MRLKTLVDEFVANGGEVTKAPDKKAVAKAAAEARKAERDTKAAEKATAKAAREKAASEKAAAKAAPKTPAEKTINDRQAALFAVLENGATIKDIQAAGYIWAAAAVLKMAERNGYTTSVQKGEDGRNRYFAKKA